MSSRIALLLAWFVTVLLFACGNDPKPTPDADANCTNPGSTAYLGTCTADGNCMSCLCKNFGHSTVCTKTCAGPADCPAPSGGCTPDGFCRP